MAHVPESPEGQAPPEGGGLPGVPGAPGGAGERRHASRAQEAARRYLGQERATPAPDQAGEQPGAGPEGSVAPSAGPPATEGSAGGAVGAGPEAGDGLGGLSAPTVLSEAERQRDEFLDSLRRLQAEFDNYRKRMDRQQKDMAELAATALVKKLLPVLDTADLALAHGGGEEVKQLAGALYDVLGKEGLQRVDPEGQPFDPEHHDAVAHEPAEGDGAPDVPEVVEVLRAGYEWKGRVLRPAMVKVRG